MNHSLKSHITHVCPVTIQTGEYDISKPEIIPNTDYGHVFFRHTVLRNSIYMHVHPDISTCLSHP